VPDDPWSRLVQARRDYAVAVVARHDVNPGEPGYRKAVHRVGVTWAQVLHWERRVERERATESRFRG